AADEPELEDFEALYASVTPSAHTDMGPSQSTKAKPARVAPATRRVDVAAGSRAPRASNPWKRVAIGTITLAAILGVVVGGYALGGGSDDPAASPAAAQASSSAPSIDQAKVADLMAKFQADPKDVTTLMALANEFYAGGEYDTAGTWLDKVLAIDAGNVEALLAQGAVAFNNADLASAKATWDKVVAIDPKNVEAHYDLGFLYLNQQTPDWGGVQREWNEVVALDPESDLAKSVKAHLESLASASMLPGTSPAAQGASPAASSAATPASSPAASTQP
ncbi:MAG TPA: hypothetical protein VFQ75_02425, partial [Candidatus Limnocylindrales bacterium]|nr:hypothetical protein [Candidatus Limnocylindrales bacterium]